MSKVRPGDAPFNVYLESESIGSLDSFEGIPEASPSTAARPSSVGERLYGLLERLNVLAPGLLLALAVAFVATHVSHWLGQSLFGTGKSPVSPILITVILGLLVRNTIGLPSGYREGLTFCVKVLLRVGVALLGLRLSLVAVGEIGLRALPLVLGCIAVAIAGVVWLGKLAGISRTLSALIAVGTSICGVSAIVATGPALRADDEEVSYAVAVITLYGILGLLLYPFLAHTLFQGDPRLAGFFLGTSIHDTSQVAGAALMYETTYSSPEALEVATTTKLVRNVLMGAVIPFLAIWGRRQESSHSKVKGLPLHKRVPGFVIAFVCLAAFRSLGDLGPRAFGFLPAESWESLLSFASTLSMGCLTLALASIGLGTSTQQLRPLGWKPLGIGFAAALLVGLTSWTLLHLLF